MRRGGEEARERENLSSERRGGERRRVDERKKVDGKGGEEVESGSYRMKEAIGQERRIMGEKINMNKRGKVGCR